MVWEIAFGIILAVIIIAIAPILIYGAMFIIPILFIIGGVVLLFYNPDAAITLFILGTLVALFYGCGRMFTFVVDAGGIGWAIGDLVIITIPAFTEEQKLKKLERKLRIDNRITRNKAAKNEKSKKQLEKRREYYQKKINLRLAKISNDYKKYKFIEFIEKRDGGYFYIRYKGRLSVDHFYRVYAYCASKGTFGGGRVEYRVVAGQVKDDEDKFNESYENEIFDDLRSAIKYLRKKLRKGISGIIANN